MELTFWLAFLGGLLSFFSPCILPIAPGYLGIISGTTFANLQTGSVSRRKILVATGAFILGFSMVFIILGLASSMLGQLLLGTRGMISRMAGVLVILLGLHQAGWLPFAWLYHEKRFLNHNQIGVLGAFLTGLAFSLGWTPCVGPILGSILTMAGSQGSAGYGILLLSAYSIGLALPFILLAVAFEQASKFFIHLKNYIKYLEWTSGILLIVMGLLLLTGSLAVVSSWFIRISGGWNLENIIKN